MQDTKKFRAARGLPTSGLLLPPGHHTKSQVVLYYFKRTCCFFRPKGEIFWGRFWWVLDGFQKKSQVGGKAKKKHCSVPSVPSKK